MDKKKKGGTKKCEKGEISRIPYTYTKKTGKKINVSETCIKDKGLKGKTLTTQKIPYNISSTFNIEDLSKYGYTDIKNKTVTVRRKSLENAMKSYGPLDVMRKLNILMILNRNTNPELAKRFENDRNWIINTHGKGKY